MRICETLRARTDIDALYLHGIETFGEAATDAYIARLLDVFDLLQRFPAMARQRTEVDPPVRILPHEAHLIVYRADIEEISILRILPAQADWLHEMSISQ